MMGPGGFWLITWGAIALVLIAFLYLVWALLTKET